MLDVEVELAGDGASGGGGLPVVTGMPARIRLLEAHGFIDEIGAVYGPKPAGYETGNPREIAVLISRGAAHQVLA